MVLGDTESHRLRARLTHLEALTRERTTEKRAATPRGCGHDVIDFRREIIELALHRRALSGSQCIVRGLKNLLFHREKNLTDALHATFSGGDQVLGIADIIPRDFQTSGARFEPLREYQTGRVIPRLVDPLACGKTELVNDQLGICVPQCF